jgi:hypothetical protein
MKRIIITACIAVLTFAGVQAQVKVGPKIGLNTSNMYVKGGIRVNDFNIPWKDMVQYRQGLNIGAFLNYQTAPRFALQTEIIYSQQGFKDDILLMDYNGKPVIHPDGKIVLHYLNIPILLRGYAGETGLFAEAGLQTGFRLSSNYIITAPGSNEISSLNPYPPAKSAVDLSFASGIGCHFRFGATLSIRYNIGLTKAIQVWDASRNQVFQFTLAYDLLTF